MSEALPEGDGTWIYTLRPRRIAMLTEGLTDAEMAAAGAHFARLEAEHASGRVLSAGRTLVTDERNFAAIVFRAPTAEEAAEFAASDPAVIAGVFEVEVFPYEAMLP